MASDALFPHIQAKDQLGPWPAFSLGYPLMLAEQCQELVPVVGLKRLKPDGPMGGWRQLIEETKQGLRRLGRKRSGGLGRKSQDLGEVTGPPASTRGRRRASRQTGPTGPRDSGPSPSAYRRSPDG